MMKISAVVCLADSVRAGNPNTGHWSRMRISRFDRFSPSMVERITGYWLMMYILKLEKKTRGEHGKYKSVCQVTRNAWLRSFAFSNSSPWITDWVSTETFTWRREAVSMA